MTEKLCINLGCGPRPLAGFKNLDARKADHVDYVHDINKPLPFEDNSVDVLFASHIIEHIWWNKVPEVLADWFRVLKPDGHLDIWTNNFDQLVYNYTHSKNPMELHAINQVLFNKDDYKGEEHKSVFGPYYLSNLLKKVGFREVFSIKIENYPFKNLNRINNLNFGLRAIKSGSNGVLDEFEI